MSSTFIDITCLMIAYINSLILSVSERITRYSRLCTDEQDALALKLSEAIDALSKVSFYLENNVE